MTDKIQTFTITLLRPAVFVAGKCSQTVRHLLIYAGVFLLCLQQYFRSTGVAGFVIRSWHLPSVISFVLLDLICCFFLAMVVVGCIEGPMKKQRWSIPLAVLWFAFGLMRLLSAAFASLDWVISGLLFTVVIPLVFFVFGSHPDRKKLLLLICRGFAFYHIVFCVASLFFAPLSDGDQYCAIMNNPNALGQYLTAALVVLLFFFDRAVRRARPLFVSFKQALRQREFASGGKIVWPLIRSFFWPVSGLGVTIAMMLFSASRTAALASAAMVVVWLGLRTFREQRGERLRSLSVCVVSFAMIISVGYVATFGVIQGISLASTRIESLITGKEIKNSSLATVGGLLVDMNKRYEAENHAGGDVTSGRSKIWRAYVQLVDFRGHEKQQVYAAGYGMAGNAHNNVLQILFESGIIVGVLYVALTVAGPVRAACLYIRNRKNGRRRDVDYWLILAVGFWVTSMLATIIDPFSYELSLFYWIGHAFILQKDEQEKPALLCETAHAN